MALTVVVYVAQFALLVGPYTVLSYLAKRQPPAWLVLKDGAFAVPTADKTQPLLLSIGPVLALLVGRLGLGQTRDFGLVYYFGVLALLTVAYSIRVPYRLELYPEFLVVRRLLWNRTIGWSELENDRTVLWRAGVRLPGLHPSDRTAPASKRYAGLIFAAVAVDRATLGTVIQHYLNNRVARTMIGTGAEYDRLLAGSWRTPLFLEPAA